MLANPTRMLENTPRQIGVRRDLRLLAIWVGLVALWGGFGANTGFAKCGSATGAARWKYASTDELLSWDGRWWVAESTTIGMEDNSHFDADTKPCSRCGGRPLEDQPNQSLPTLVKTNVQPVVLSPRPMLINASNPPTNKIALLADPLASRGLEIAKRPPKSL